MSDDDNYPWLDQYSHDPSARPATPPSNPTAPSTPPRPATPSPTPAPPPPPMYAAGPGAVPPMASRRRTGHRDPLAEKLLAGRPPRQQGSRRLPTKDKLTIAAVALAIIAAVVYANFIGPDTSSIGGLDIGDCFEAPDTPRVKRVTIQDCAMPHQGQVVAEANGLRDDSEEKCALAFNELDADRMSGLPGDATFGVLNATISHRCVVISQSGQLTQSLTGP